MTTHSQPHRAMIELRQPAAVDTAASRQAYDALYSEHDVTQHGTALYHWLLRLVDARPGGRLLDVSCGTGRLLAVARAQELRAFGVDFSRAALQQTPQHAPVFVGDSEQLPIQTGAFDYAINVGSMEHYEDMDRSVREMARVLKPAGVGCILVPNSFGLLWTIWHVKNHGDVPDDGQPLQRFGTLEQWRRLIETNGLIVEAVHPFEQPRPNGRAEWQALLAHPKVNLTKLVLGRFVPLPLASMFVFVCRPHAVSPV